MLGLSCAASSALAGANVIYLVWAAKAGNQPMARKELYLYTSNLFITKANKEQH